MEDTSVTDAVVAVTTDAFPSSVSTVSPFQQTYLSSLVAPSHSSMGCLEGRFDSLFDALNDDVLYRIFRAAVGRPAHFRYKTHGGGVQDPYDDFFGDRRGVLPTQNVGYPMVFVLPRVCRRWRNVMKSFPAIYSRASIVVRDTSSIVPLTWWRKRASHLESLFLDGHFVDGLGDLSAMNIGLLSLLSVDHMRALCLGVCFAEGATRYALSTIQCLTNLIQLQIYRAAHSFVSGISHLTRLSKLKVLELGYAHNQDIQMTELSSKNFPLSLERLALCEAFVNMDLLTQDGYLTNLRSLKLMSCSVAGEFCEHLGHLCQLTKVVVDDSVLESGGDTEAINSDFLPDDLRKLSALENIKDLSIQGLDCGPRGYFEWLGEEVMRAPPFNDLQSLSLCFASLGVIADSFDLYYNLTFLYIVQIRFETIPEPVLRLPNLVRLEMISCEISNFPDTIPCCSDSITTLNLCGNKLRYIPKGLASWNSLQRLEFTENPILDFANIECLLELQNLKTVALLEGIKILNAATLESFCQEFAHMTAALKLGYVCAKLESKEPACRMYL